MKLVQIHIVVLTIAITITMSSLFGCISEYVYVEIYLFLVAGTNELQVLPFYERTLYVISNNPLQMRMIFKTLVVNLTYEEERSGRLNLE